MIISSFFPSINGDRPRTTAQMAEHKKAQITTGIYPNYANLCAVTKVNNTLKTSVDTGGGIIQGYEFYNDAAVELTHAAGDATHGRIDLVSLRLDLSVEARTILLVILQGTPASSPVAPTLTQNETIYEISLASVLVPSGVANLNTATLTDTRSYSYANAQSSQIVAGTYTGDGTASKTITLGFTPSAIITMTKDGTTYSYNNGLYGGLAFTSNPVMLGSDKVLEIVDGGFKAYFKLVASAPDVLANTNAQVYHYIAYR